MEARIAAVEQRKDDAKRLKKRYSKEMNVNLAHMYYEATQHVALPIEQRTMTHELLDQRLGVEMGKFDPLPYLQEMGSDISITFPIDVLAIIAARKATEKAKIDNANVFVVSESTALQPEAQILPLPIRE